MAIYREAAAAAIIAVVAIVLGFQSTQAKTQLFDIVLQELSIGNGELIAGSKVTYSVSGYAPLNIAPSGYSISLRFEKIREKGGIVSRIAQALSSITGNVLSYAYGGGAGPFTASGGNTIQVGGEVVLPSEPGKYKAIAEINLETGIRKSVEKVIEVR